MATHPTFGKVISEQRKLKQMSQKDLAALVKREDGVAISPQYLNDIEHDRRNPSSDHLVRQLAQILGLKTDYLYFLAGKFPTDVMGKAATPDRVERAMVAFRREFKKTEK